MTGTVTGQDALFDVAGLLPQVPDPDLTWYDVILVNISGGKDSQATLDVIVKAATKAGVPDRVVTVFADLGPEDEWPGTRELAAEHAAHYGLRHEVVYREIVDEHGELRQQTLTEHIEERGKWPDAARRYCTSDMKRAPIWKLMTRLAREQREAGIAGRQVRILNVMGMRAEESPHRRLMKPFSHDDAASNKTVRWVDEWLPVHSWVKADVWARIAEAGTRPHPIYAKGMPRLSCRACVLAGKDALKLFVKLDPDGAERRAELETRMGHSFKHNLSMRQIIDEASAEPGVQPVKDWVA